VHARLPIQLLGGPVSPRDGLRVGWSAVSFYALVRSHEERRCLFWDRRRVANHRVYLSMRRKIVSARSALRKSTSLACGTNPSTFETLVKPDQAKRAWPSSHARVFEGVAISQFPPQGSRFQKWKACPDTLLNGFTPSNTLAWSSSGIYGDRF